MLMRQSHVFAYACKGTLYSLHDQRIKVKRRYLLYCTHDDLGLKKPTYNPFSPPFLCHLHY